MQATGPSSQLAPLEILDWGRTHYTSAWHWQEERVRARVAAQVPDALIFTEHDPVFTVGVRKGADAHLVWSAEELRHRGIDLVRTNRGGDFTYHGPGQIVGYPILDISRRKDLHAYLRFLEQVLINAIGTFGLAASRREGKTGIWLAERKIAALGVAVKRWTTFHGFALNVNTDLAPFAGIIPCGIRDGAVTSMKAELGFDIDQEEVKRILGLEFRELFLKFLSNEST